MRMFKLIKQIFWKKIKKNNLSATYVICAERESVCMGDDCTAPNAKNLTYDASDMLSDFMVKIMRYVPAMKSVVWSISSNGKIIAYLYSDETSEYKYELVVPDMNVSKLYNKKIYCRYYYKGKIREMCSESESLLDKVKQYEQSMNSYGI